MMLSLPKTETLLSTAASLAATAILFRSITKDLIPQPVHDYFHSTLRKISTRLSSQLTIIIDEFDDLTANQMFQAANVYLGSNLSPLTRRIKVNKPEKEKELAVTIDRDQELLDVFQGVELRWVLVSSHIETHVSSNKKRNDGGTFSRSELRYFELSFKSKYRDLVLSSYLPHILRKAKAIREEKKTLKLHTIDYNGTDYWGSINFDHPATFDTIAMDPDMKTTLLEDLNQFLAGKEFYRRVGKAWKRGYLLYGPPGTGKSSLVAAMANYLKFDVYDLDLKEVQCNSDLKMIEMSPGPLRFTQEGQRLLLICHLIYRYWNCSLLYQKRLLIGTGNRSILVVEDIDRSFESLDEDKVTLSGLLNFIDGLWSSCGDERIIVFTTNYKDQLDPVLLRPGRMDVHLHMSYCTFFGFKRLASNYLQIHEHPLLEEIEQLLEKVRQRLLKLLESC
ncbi:hypothetical protein JCGZ_04469 [Jatropha curcas]|uniref:AAA+ ATPase domain-containing protein n=1 Tax=Jatropha curcas TaxID=180498 RepID=A0A067L373_JATCU|nr:hypothetical protein JCGZ_04469 [Jatropha curcas]